MAAQRLQRIGGSTVAKAERVLAEVLSGGNRGGGSGGKVRGSARHSQLQGLHQILNALEVETVSQPSRCQCSRVASQLDHCCVLNGAHAELAAVLYCLLLCRIV